VCSLICLSSESHTYSLILGTSLFLHTETHTSNPALPIQSSSLNRLYPPSLRAASRSSIRLVSRLLFFAIMNALIVGLLIWAYFGLYTRWVSETYETISDLWRWIACIAYASTQSYNTLVMLLLFRAMFVHTPRRVYHVCYAGMALQLLWFLVLNAAGVWQMVLGFAFTKFISVAITVICIFAMAWIILPQSGDFHRSSASSLELVQDTHRHCAEDRYGH